MTRAKIPPSPPDVSNSDAPLRVGLRSFVYITQSLVNENILVRDDSLGYIGSLERCGILFGNFIITRTPAVLTLQGDCAYADGHPLIGKWQFSPSGIGYPGSAPVPARPRIAGSVPMSEETSRKIDSIMAKLRSLTNEVQQVRSRQREKPEDILKGHVMRAE